MKSRNHIHPAYIRRIRYLITLLAFGFPAWMLVAAIPGLYPNKAISVVEILCLAPTTTIFLLVAAYFYQDVIVDDDGLLVKFLWKELRVKWKDIIEIKPVWVYRYFPEHLRPVIVIAGGLTPFHRILGIFYGLSMQQAFVIYSSISDFQKLKDNIRMHLNSRRNTK